MRVLKAGLVMAVVLCWLGVQAQTKTQRVVFTGRLSRAMAIGAETTGWTVDLDSPITIEGKEVRSVEISYVHPERLDKLVNQHVQVKGRITHKQGVETGVRPVVEVSSIRAMAS